MARRARKLGRRLSPTFPVDMREMVHLAAAIERTNDTAFVRDAAAYRAAITIARDRSPIADPTLEEMYVDLLVRVQQLEAALKAEGIPIPPASRPRRL